MKYCEELQNYRTNMCDVENSEQYEGKGSSVRTSIRKDKRRKKVVLSFYQ